MIVKLIIRNAGPGAITMRTDYKREATDTPRINNFALDIVAKLDEAIARNQAAGAVNVAQVV